jgi:hypothetical protein
MVTGATSWHGGNKKDLSVGDGCHNQSIHTYNHVLDLMMEAPKFYARIVHVQRPPWFGMSVASVK